MQYLKKRRVYDRMQVGRPLTMQTSFEGITKKYRSVKTGKINVDLLSLKSEIESYIKNRQGGKRKDDDSVTEAQDMLLDVTQMIEEGHCDPFRPKQL